MTRDPEEEQEMTPNEQHAAALEQYRSAANALQAAEESCRRASDLARSLESRLATGFADIEQRIAGEFAAAIEGAAGDDEPAFVTSADLRALATEKSEMEFKLAAARRAGEVMEGKRQTAESAARDAREALQDAAFAVVFEQVEAEATELRALEEKAAMLRANLTAYARIKRLSRGSMKSLPSSRELLDFAARMPEGIPHPTINTPQAQRANESMLEWEARLDRLLDIDGPERAKRAAQRIVREQPTKLIRDPTQPSRLIRIVDDAA
jgi:hypothetical protein